MKFDERYIEASTIPSVLGDLSVDPYRYLLKRVWDKELSRVFFVAMNPSTATALDDDNTITREYGFAKAWGYGGFVKGNICALRSTDPIGLRHVLDPVGPENDMYLERVAEAAAQGGMLVVAAWGALSGQPKWLHNRADKVLELLRKHVDVYAIRITQGGMPEHPLYLPSYLKPVLYRAKRPVVGVAG